MQTHQTIALSITGALLIAGATVAAYKYQQATPQNNLALDTHSQAVVSKSTKFDIEKLERLEAKITSLQARVEYLESTENASALNLEEAGIAQTPIAEPFFRSARRNGQISIRENLISVGIDPILADQIAQKQSELALARLVLKDKAIREGYFNQAQYRDELSTLNETEISLRDEIGDESFDRFLFTSGQANRIAISSVITGSAADNIGIQDGDLLLTYGGQKLFQWRELQSKTTTGVSGELVDISVLRNGSELSFSIPRGPLGVRLSQTRKDPGPS